jgi:hypothetical protein
MVADRQGSQHQGGVNVGAMQRCEFRMADDGCELLCANGLNPCELREQS